MDIENSKIHDLPWAFHGFPWISEECFIVFHDIVLYLIATCNFFRFAEDRPDVNPPITGNPPRTWNAYPEAL